MSQTINNQIRIICNPKLFSKDYVDGVLQGLLLLRYICWWHRKLRKRIDKTIKLIEETREQLVERIENGKNKQKQNQNNE